MPRNDTSQTGLLREAERAIEASDWSRAEHLLLAHARRDRAGDVRSLLLWHRLEEGRGTRAQLVRRVAAFVDAHPALATAPHVRLTRGLALFACGESESARTELLAARDALRDGRDPLALAHAENGIGRTYLTPLDAPRARRAFSAAREVASRAGIFERVAAADLNMATVALESGDLEGAARAYRAALAAGERGGDEVVIRLAAYNLGNCLHDLGRDRAARRHLVRARAIAEKRREPWFAAWSSLILGDLERKAGHPEAAEAAYADVERTFTSLGGPTPTERAWVDVRRAELALERGRPDLALKLARAGLAPGVEATPRLYGGLVHGKATLRLGRAREAARELERVAVDAERMGHAELAWRARANAARARTATWVEARLGGAPRDALASDGGAARDSAMRGIAALDSSTASMSRTGRRAFLREAIRADDTRALLELEAIASVPTVPAASTHARTAWLRLLERIREVAREETPSRVLAHGLDAIIEIAGAGRVWAWIDPSATSVALQGGRDAEARDLLARNPPRGETRPIHQAGKVAGRLLLEPAAKGAAFTDEALELADAVATLTSVLVDAARARAALAARFAEREEQARELALELARTEAALGEARHKLDETGAPPSPGRGAMLGQSRAMRDVYARLDRLRRSELPVLVTGESGTGKELVARAIHDESARARGPFVAVNCGALAEQLLESELFGHVRGAFTGAERDAAGLFAVAHRGTLLLDEIGEMSLAMQAKLLRVLQEGEVRPVGGGATRRVDVRVIAATHRDLDALVRDGRFREDLFYRLHVLTVHVPPLRARGDDVARLARRFLERIAPERRFAPAAVAWLVEQQWPGNVRELKAVVEAAAVLSESDVIGAEAFARPRVMPRGARATDALPLRLDELEAWAIERALERHGGSRAAAARALGIGRATLYRKLAEHGVATRAGR